MDIIGLACVCAAAAVLLKILGAVNPEIRSLAALLAASLIAVRFLGGFEELTSSVKELFDRTELDGEYLHVIFKSLGICFITQFACGSCRDCGENLLADQLELAGKAALLLTSLPLFTAAIDIVSSLINT